METQLRLRILLGIIVIVAVTMACDLPVAGGTATPTPTLTPTGGAPVTGGGNTGGSNAGTGNGNSGSPTKVATPVPTPIPTPVPTPEPTPEPTLADVGGAYVVKQIETLGGEAISGVVCDLTKPFSVLSVTPKVTFTFVFTPKDAKSGNVGYSYSIPSAGESHDANGTYKIALLNQTGGTLQLSLRVSDHVVFHGFDGNIPLSYKFNLAPTGSPCP